MTYNNPNGRTFDSFFSRSQVVLETQMRGSDSIFDFVNLLYFKYHKINFKHGGLYNESPDWIRKKQ